MEALAVILEPYKDIVAKIAGIVTVGQMFSGSFICLDIYKQGNTKNIPIMPFLGGIVMGGLNLQFGYIIRDNTMIMANLVGLALTIVYLMVYFNYSTEKMKVWAQMGGAGAITAAGIAYAQMEDPARVENRLGFIITAFMFYLISSPLFDLGNIMKKQSTEGMPFPIIFSGTIVTFMWLLYGIIIRNSFLVLQNTVAFALCSVQLSLFVIYPSKPKSKAKAQAKKTN